MNGTRRRFLRAATAAGVATLAGCGGTSPDDEEADAEEDGTEGTVSSQVSRDHVEGDGGPGGAPVPPSSPVFLDGEEIAAVRSKLGALESPWWGTFLRLLPDAGRGQLADPRSVVDDGAPAGESDPHAFGTDCKDECRTRHDYEAAIDMGDRIRDLALAYQFSGFDAFARRSIDLLHHWSVDPETRMEPSGRNHGETYFSIELHVTIPKLIYGASLVRDHPYWGEEYDGAAEAVDEWVEAYLRDMEDGEGEKAYRGVNPNNIYAWWVVGRATAAAYIGDGDSLSAAVEDWKHGALEQVDPDGGLEFEKDREAAYHYSFYGMKALFMTAEIARRHGEDLYEYAPEGEPVLRTVADHHLPYLVDPSEWEWGFEGDGPDPADREEGASVYELAYSRWQDPAYLDAIEAVGRPVRDRRLLGWTTLTHGNGFGLDA